MTHSRLSALGLLLAVLLCFQTAHAQQTNSPNDNQAAADAALRDKAYKLLDSLSEQLSSLQSAENRARIGSNIAESIWSHDEKHARDLFALVAEDIKLGLQQTKEKPELRWTFEVFRKLRQDNVERIAKHDPELALAFLKETLPSLIEAAPRRPDGEVPVELMRGEHDEELRLATKIGPRNAEVAVQLARQSLEQGLSNGLLMLLIRLSQKKREQTQLLYKDIVQKVREDDFHTYYPSIAFAMQLVEHFTPPAADETTYRELIDIMLAKAIAKGCAGRSVEREEQENICVYIGALVPLMEKYNPGQARRLRAWTPQRDYNTDTTHSYSELNYLYEYGTVDEVLALRSKYPTLDSEILRRAISKAEAEGDIERAQKLASTYSGSPEAQQSLKEQLDVYNLSEVKLDEELAKAEKEWVNVSPQERAERLLMAADFFAVGNRKFALKLLDRANASIDTFSPGERQTRFQIALATIYCLLNDDRGFSVIESLLPKLNDLVTAATKLDGYDTHYLRDGEWNMTGAGSTGGLLTVLANNAGSFAWCDFDRAVSLAAQFERAEIRMMAQLKIAQGILAGRPKPFQRGPGY
ncbi:MAG TPA: hypothetical protein VGK82_12130 [Pyrinomonadaceae bacterium]